MTDKTAIEAYFSAYINTFPGEKERTGLFADFLANNDSGMLYTRKNFNGHITTSAFIIDPVNSAMLLLRHKSLERWLQPGGHVEQDVSLLASALREAEEETGIQGALLVNRPISADPEIPFDIDSHYIPPNPKKMEDGHYHHDLRYVFVYTGDGDISYNRDEATGQKWVSFTDLTHDTTFAAVIDKMRATGIVL